MDTSAASHWTCAAREVRAKDVPDCILAALAKNDRGNASKPDSRDKPNFKAIKDEAFRCSSCLSEYDANFGDVQANVLAGTAFDALPEDWMCPVCSGPKSHFERVTAA
jgi:rubredoxin